MKRVLFSGDSLIVSESFPDTPAHNRLVDLIHSCDIALTNFEMVVPSEKAYPGTFWLQGPPLSAGAGVITLLKSLGFSAVSIANNHMLDWGIQGLLDTVDALKKQAMPFSGAGPDLSMASEPAIVSCGDTNLAMLAISGRYPQWGMAENGIRNEMGKPGVNGIPISEKPLISCEFAFRGHQFSFSSLSRYLPNSYSVHSKHENRIIEQIKRLSRNYGFVFVSLHIHQMPEQKTAPAFQRRLCRKFIDAGADGVFVHGSHFFKGLEVYKQKPIFLGLGNLFFEIEKVMRPVPGFYLHYQLAPSLSVRDAIRQVHHFRVKPEAYHSLLPICTFEDRVLTRIELYPIDLGLNDPLFEGIPRLGSINTLHQYQKSIMKAGITCQIDNAACCLAIRMEK
jgi:poly-gamma-glutamate synthesis protein (capsule biosynthesis protein)